MRKPAAKETVRKTPAGKIIERTDRLKKHQWIKMCKNGDVPKEAEQAFARATSKERREAINSAIVRKEDGTYELNLRSRELDIIISKHNSRSKGTRGVGLIEAKAPPIVSYNIVRCKYTVMYRMNRTHSSADS